jgi:hypothetical protein
MAKLVGFTFAAMPWDNGDTAMWLRAQIEENGETFQITEDQIVSGIPDNLGAAAAFELLATTMRELMGAQELMGHLVRGGVSIIEL